MWTLKTKIKSAIWRNNSRSWVDCVRERDRDGQRPRELPLHRDDQREEEAEHPPGGRGIHEATVARQRAITLVLRERPDSQTGGRRSGGGRRPRKTWDAFYDRFVVSSWDYRPRLSDFTGDRVIWAWMCVTWAPRENKWSALRGRT